MARPLTEEQRQKNYEYEHQRWLNLTAEQREARRRDQRIYRQLHLEEVRAKDRKRYALLSDEARIRKNTTSSVWTKERRESLITALLKTQLAQCALCGNPDPGDKRGWHVDHDHSCGPNNHFCDQCIRGLVCRVCNLVILAGVERALALGLIVEFNGSLKDYLQRRPLLGQT